MTVEIGGLTIHVFWVCGGLALLCVLWMLFLAETLAARVGKKLK